MASAHPQDEHLPLGGKGPLPRRQKAQARRRSPARGCPRKRGNGWCRPKSVWVDLVVHGWHAESSSKVGRRLERRPVGMVRPGWKATERDCTFSACSAMRSGGLAACGLGFELSHTSQATSPATASDSWRVTVRHWASKNAQPTAPCITTMGRTMMSSERPNRERGSRRLMARRAPAGPQFLLRAAAALARRARSGADTAECRRELRRPRSSQERLISRAPACSRRRGRSADNAACLGSASILRRRRVTWISTARPGPFVVLHQLIAVDRLRFGVWTEATCRSAASPSVSFTTAPWRVSSRPLHSRRLKVAERETCSSLGRGGGGAAQDRLDAQHQLLRLERLCRR